ncbi:MAG: polysaccharide biosynthesis/export family protein [Halioglobus sp.]|nr:polysaccharide biosynthesis/export family protein [Halioglobus sp.]
MYILGPGDVLEIKFPFVQQYSATLAVGPDGRISLPLLGAVVAEGKSPGELQKELVSAYSGRLNKPIVVLNVVQTASSTVVSDGERVRVVPSGMDNATSDPA